MLGFQYEPKTSNVSKICSNEKLDIFNAYEKRTPVAPLMTLFIGWNILTNVSKRYILDVVIVVDTSLSATCFILYLKMCRQVGLIWQKYHGQKESHGEKYVNLSIDCGKWTRKSTKFSLSCLISFTVVFKYLYCCCYWFTVPSKSNFGFWTIWKTTLLLHLWAIVFELIILEETIESIQQLSLCLPLIIFSFITLHWSF